VITRLARWLAACAARWDVPVHRELVLLVLVTAGLNFCGLTWGLPGADDWAIDSITPVGPLHYARQMVEAGSWWSKYPPLHFTLLVLVYAPFVAYLLLSGGLTLGPGVAGYPYGLAQPEFALTVFTMLARVVSATMGIGTAVAVYLITREIAGRRAGFLAGLLFGCSPLAIYYAHTGNLDVPYMFWSSLALLCLVRVARGAPRVTYVLLGIFTAAAIATKDQAYGLFVLMPLPLLVLHRRAPEGRGFIDRRLLLGFASAVVTYLLAANVLIDPHGWLRHLWYVTHEGSAPYQMFPATFTGYAALAERTARLILDSFAAPAAVLGACGMVWTLRRRRPGAGLVAFAGCSYLVLFLGPILYVLPRFVLPAVLVLAIFAGIAGSVLWDTRHGLARLLVVVVLACSSGYGASMNLGLLWDTRYAAEEWLALHLPADAVVGTDGELTYLPRLPRGTATVPVEMTAHGLATESTTPEYLVLSDAHYRRYLRRAELRAATRRLLHGDDEYEPVAVFQPRWSPAAELIPTVAPRIVILRRRHDKAAGMPPGVA
jgi:4-amino-4-deoxy-L-arabinose transferase-like glycosyltransferase